MTPARILLPLLAIAIAPPIHAECACRCVEGVARTLCTALDEAASRIDACGDPLPVCPPPALAADVARYDPPSGAAHCRSARLLDSTSREYSVAARVCDVAEGTLAQDPAR